MRSKSKITRALTAITGLAVAGALLTSCAGDGAPTTPDAPGNDSPSTSEPSSELQELYEKVKESGETEITIYQAANAVFESVHQEFNRVFPDIKVNAVSIIGAPAEARLRAEFSTGKHEADLVQSGLSDIIPFSKNGWFEPFHPETAETVPDENRGEDYIDSALQMYGFVYNTDLVAEDEVPTSWDELLSSPEWKGKIGLGDPLASNGSTQGIIAAMNTGSWDDSSLEKLHAQDPKIYDSSAAIVNAAVTGQVPISMMSSVDAYLVPSKEGAPIGFSGILDDGNPVNPFAMAVVKNAPHPNVAKLYMAWFFSEDAQAFLAENTGLYGAVPGTPSPSDAPALEDVKEILRLPGPDNFDEVFADVLGKTAKIFK